MGFPPHIDWPKLRRRSRRYWAISVQIAAYFAVHTLILTAIPLSIDNPTIRPVALAAYMGAGILFDSFATALSTRIGNRRVVRIAGGLLMALALIAATGIIRGWLWIVLASLFAICSSLLYIPGIAYFTNLLGKRQQDGQRISVVLQRGGALAASFVISGVLASGLASILWWVLLAIGLSFGALSYRFPRPPRSEEGVSLNPISAIAASVSSAVRSPLLMLGLTASMTMPVVFLLHGSILPVHKTGQAAALVGVGLVIREAVSVLSVLIVARGGFLRSNVEFIIAAVLAGAGSVLAALSSHPAAVIGGIAAGGIVVASGVVVSVLNVNKSARQSFKPWAHFGAMGMSARFSGLVVPFVFGLVASPAEGGAAAESGGASSGIFGFFTGLGEAAQLAVLAGSLFGLIVVSAVVLLAIVRRTTVR